MLLGNYFLYFLFALPALILGLWAQSRVRSTFRKFSQMGTSRGLTGAQIARSILDSQGLSNVRVERVQGFLSDHYDPIQKVLRLSPDVYDGASVAAAGVAAHEAGHALQDKSNYFPLTIRSAMVPSVQFGSWLGPIIFIVGFLLSGTVGTTIAWVGLGLFGATALFAVVTLPVEFDASNRAKQLLTNQGLMFQDEMTGVNRVLNAAALTYVAAAIQAISTLLYYAFLLLGQRD
ncbi:MAG: zinc metallopeptidase [Chloroflexi bacterium]|nr:zinc metallopeptidase [Chloroflexota bacterium]